MRGSDRSSRDRALRCIVALAANVAAKKITTDPWNAMKNVTFPSHRLADETLLGACRKAGDHGDVQSAPLVIRSEGISL
jgi:hypothetical protein